MADITPNTRVYNVQATDYKREYISLIIDGTSYAPSTTEGNVTVKFISKKIGRGIKNKSPTSFVIPLETTPMTSFYNLKMIESIIKVEAYIPYDDVNTLYNTFIQRDDTIYFGVNENPTSKSNVRVYSGFLRGIEPSFEEKRYLCKYFKNDNPVVGAAESNPAEYKYTTTLMVPVTLELVVGVRL
jgi:hypothetical protein